jgi:hypothetical protein
MSCSEFGGTGAGAGSARGRILQRWVWRPPAGPDCGSRFIDRIPRHADGGRYPGTSETTFCIAKTFVALVLMYLLY